MEILPYLSICFIILAFQAWTIHSQCVELEGTNNTISDQFLVINRNIYRKCWKIDLPPKKLIEISTVPLARSSVPSTSSSSYSNKQNVVDCKYAYIQIKVDGEEISKSCSINSLLGNKLLSAIRDKAATVEVEVYISNNFDDRTKISFRWDYNIWDVSSQYVELERMSDTISHEYSVNRSEYYRMSWKINLPSKTYIKMSTKALDIPSTLPSYINKDCKYTYVEIKVDGKQISKFCSINSSQTPVIVVRDTPVTVEVEFVVYSQPYASGIKFSFQWNYNIYYSVLIRGVEEIRSNAIRLIKSKHISLWGWKEDTPRAETALFLSGGASFNGITLKNLMVKQTELRTALDLTQDIDSNQQLSSFINGLLVTCLNPRNFYGHDFVKRLKDQVESSGNFTHPAAYLALCNANETWPLRSTTDLSNILSSDSGYLFVRDIQAFAIMALSCMSNRTNFLYKEENAGLKSLYTKCATRMINYQQTDGSFGNVHTTSLVTQALLSYQEIAKDWNFIATMQYLMKELKYSTVDFLTAYTALPVLNGKSLTDIAAINCSEGGIVSEMSSYQGPKILVQYSLYIGEEKDVRHTISLSVPRNVTAYKVMQYAAAHDPKYQFNWKTVSGKMYVYEIANIPNDPERGKFWLLHVKLRKTGYSFIQSISNPDQVLLNDGEQIIMWYKTAQI